MARRRPPRYVTVEESERESGRASTVIGSLLATLTIGYLLYGVYLLWRRLHG